MHSFCKNEIKLVKKESYSYLAGIIFEYTAAYVCYSLFELGYYSFCLFFKQVIKAVTECCVKCTSYITE